MLDIDNDEISISESLLFAFLVAVDCGIWVLSNYLNRIKVESRWSGWMCYIPTILFSVAIVLLVIIVCQGIYYLLSEIGSIQYTLCQFFIYIWLFGSGCAVWYFEAYFYHDPGLKVVAVTIIAITFLVLTIHSGIWNTILESIDRDSSEPDDEWVEYHKDGSVVHVKRKYKK